MPNKPRKTRSDCRVGSFEKNHGPLILKVSAGLAVKVALTYRTTFC